MIEIITSEVASPDGYNEAIRGFTYQFKDYSVYLFLPAASLSIGALIFFLTRAAMLTNINLSN